tara:strand:- start:110 stop:316 length:207 start_codon:yes stop_codon:yes gene_type:complete
MVFHSINDKIENCSECEGKVNRIPTGGFSLNKTQSGKSKPGNILKNFIEDTKEEIKKEKSELQSREYK